MFENIEWSDCPYQNFIDHELIECTCPCDCQYQEEYVDENGEEMIICGE